MSRFRVYVKPFNDDGTYQSSFTEVTEDVIKLSPIQLAIDNNEFEVGIIKNNGVKLTLRNDQGYYNEADDLRSIFRYKRKNVIVKITWDIRDYDLICGFFSPGNEPLGGEEEIFRGVLNEISSASDIEEQAASFEVLGFESILSEIEVPYSSISNGDDFSEVILACIDQAPFNELVTVSSGNISLGTDLAIDDKTDFESRTVGEVLQSLLLAANSVLYIDNLTVYVKSRTASASVQKIFYGQASIQGIENIIAVPKIRDGLNRVFNYWTWTDTAQVIKDDTSITLYGIRNKAIDTPIISTASTSKINTILTANRDEFSLPKLELEMIVPLDYQNLALAILDKIQIDYPTVYTPFDGGLIPRYGMAIYDGTYRYPYGQWSLTLTTDTSFKIISKKIDPLKNTITLGAREI